MGICVVFLLVIALYVAGRGEASLPTKPELVTIATTIEGLYTSGRHFDLISYCESLQRKYGTLDFPLQSVTNIYVYYGVSLYNAHRTSEATEVLRKAVEVQPENLNALSNLGEVLVQTFYLDEALKCFIRGHELGDPGALPRAVRALGWSAGWQTFEEHTSELERRAQNCTVSEKLEQESGNCLLDSSSGIEYTDSPLVAHKRIEEKMAHAKVNTNGRRSIIQSRPWKERGVWEDGKARRKRIRVGFVSSDFDVHPVSQLVRGLIQKIDKKRVELFCFALSKKTSWWGTNISAEVEYFVPMHGMNHHTIASRISQFRIDILIDLNGHTMFSGLPVFAFRPSPVQVSFLGLPTTTGSEYIDYYLGDYVTNAPEYSEEFSEKLVLLPPSYIANDYAHQVGEIMDWDVDQRAQRKCFNHFEPNVDLDVGALEEATALLATLSNSQKMDPEIYHVWMNVMQQLPGSHLLQMKYRGADTYIPNLRKLARMFGVDPRRLDVVEQLPFILHLQCKTSIDLALDTIAKNGHTTGLDALYAGVPLLSLAGRPRALSRATESFAHALEEETGVVYSLKEYEDRAIRMLKTRRQQKLKASEKMKNDKTKSKAEVEKVNYAASPNLRRWRERVIQQRRASSLFNMPLYADYFTRYLEALWEMQHFSTQFPKHAHMHFHVFPSISETKGREKQFPIVPDQALYEADARVTSIFGLAPKAAVIGIDGTGKSIAQPSKSKDDSPPSLKCSNPGHQYRDVSNYPPLPPAVFDYIKKPLFLNIGGVTPSVGWLNVNSLIDSHDADGGLNHVDIQREMDDLYGIPDHSVSALYSSHTFEHMPVGENQMLRTLREWVRVIRPNGLLFLSVPDIRTLATLLLDTTLTKQEHWTVLHMIYGGQVDSGDFHYFGYDEEIMTDVLTEAGFCEIQRVGHFNLNFHRQIEGNQFEILTDSSDYIYKGYFISLNIVARLCPASKAYLPPSDFHIAHQAQPYPGMKPKPQ